MKKIIMLILVIVFLMITLSSIIIAGEGPAEALGPFGAPSAGDGDPDGSGFDGDPYGSADGPGPAPASGDGVSDGPGW